MKIKKLSKTCALIELSKEDVEQFKSGVGWELDAMTSTSMESEEDEKQLEALHEALASIIKEMDKK